MNEKNWGEAVKSTAAAVNADLAAELLSKSVAAGQDYGAVLLVPLINSVMGRAGMAYLDTLDVGDQAIILKAAIVGLVSADLKAKEVLEKLKKQIGGE